MTVIFLLLIVGIFVVSGWLLSKKWMINPSYFVFSFTVLALIGFLVNHPEGAFLMKSDGLYYEKQAAEVSTWFNGGMQGPLQLDKLKEAWPLFLGFIYFIVGREPYIGILFNAAFVACVIIMIIRAAQLMFKQTPALASAFLVLLSPMVLTMGPSLGRESVFWLGTVFLLLSGIYLLNNKWGSGIFTFLAGASLLLLIRPNLGLVLIYAFLIPVSALLIFQSNKLLKFKITSTVLITFMLLVSIPFAFSPFSSSIENVSITRADLSNTASSGFTVEEPSDSNAQKGDAAADPTQNQEASSSSTQAVPPSTSNPILDKLIYNLKVGISTLPRVIAGPFFNELSFSLLWIYLASSTFIWLLVLVTAIAQMIMSGRKYLKYTLFQIAMVIAFVGVMSVMLTNYGIIARFRIPVELILVPWSALFLTNAFRLLRDKIKLPKQQIEY